MATLSEANRLLIRDALMRTIKDQVDFTKPELKAAVDAMDEFLDNNATAINSALPSAFRTKATVPQKALLLSYVTLKRYGGINPGE